MPQILASGKTGANKYDLKTTDSTKVLPRLDMRQIAQSCQNAYEQTQGYSLSGNEGAAAAIDESLDDVTASNISNYDDSLAKFVQTLVANNSYLEVNLSSTANSIILEPRKIADINSPNGNNYSKATSLPFAFRDNLKFTFRATLTNTNATQIQITGLAGMSGAVSIINEFGSNLVGGEIVAGKFYDIILTGTSTTKKVILNNSGFGTAAYKDTGIANGQVPLIGTQSATTSLAGLSLLSSPATAITTANSGNYGIIFSAGVFQFSDGSGRGQNVSPTTKLLNANWVAGNNQGGLDTGIKTNLTWYHCYAIYNPTTNIVDFIFSLNATTPSVLPSGYTKYAWRGACYVDSTGNIANYRQDGKTINLLSQIALYDNPAIPSGLTNLSVFSPNGIRTKGLFFGVIDGGSAPNNMVITDKVTNQLRVVVASNLEQGGSEFYAYTDATTSLIGISKATSTSLDRFFIAQNAWEIPDNLY